MILRTPTANDPLSASWARAVVETIRRQRVTVAPPLVVSIAGPDGMVIGIRPGEKSSGKTVSSCWALKIDGDRAICSNCHLMISVLTVSADDDLSIALDGDEGWLCAQYNTLSKELNLYFGDAQVAYDPASQLVLVPLYRLAKDDDDNWQVELDARSMPRIGVYL